LPKRAPVWREKAFQERTLANIAIQSVKLSIRMISLPPLC
jgi:hypothetical protein